MLLAFALVPIGGGVKWPEYALALALTLIVITGTALTPWQRVPAAARLLPAAVFLVAAALLRDAGGGFTSGVATLAMLPVFWIALHGSRAGLALVILGVVAFLAVPVLAIGGPDYPATALRTGVLFVAVSGLMGATVQRLVGAVRAQRRELEQLATTDPLTATDNRRAWDSALERALADPGSQPLSVGLLDLDDVKAFNDQHGHEGGDTLLATAAGHGWLSFAPATGSRASAATSSPSCSRVAMRRTRTRCSRAWRVRRRSVRPAPAASPNGTASRPPTRSCAGPISRCTARSGPAAGGSSAPSRRRSRSPADRPLRGPEVAPGDEGAERGHERDDDRRPRHRVDERLARRVRDRRRGCRPGRRRRATRARPRRRARGRRRGASRAASRRATT